MGPWYPFIWSRDWGPVIFLNPRESEIRREIEREIQIESGERE